MKSLLCIKIVLIAIIAPTLINSIQTAYKV